MVSSSLTSSSSSSSSSFGRLFLFFLHFLMFIAWTEASEPLIELKTNTLNRFLKRYKLALIVFYQPDCMACAHLLPNYQEMAANVNEMAADFPFMVPIADFNLNENNDWNIEVIKKEETWPLIKPRAYLFRDPDFEVADSDKWTLNYEGKKVKEWDGQVEDVDDMAWFLQQYALGNDPSTLEKDRPTSYFYSEGGKHPSTSITELTSLDEVRGETENVLWIVEFYSHKCPLCNALGQYVGKAAKILDNHEGDRIKFGAINIYLFREIGKGLEFDLGKFPSFATYYRGEMVFNSDFNALFPNFFRGGGATEEPSLVVYRWGKSMVQQYWKPDEWSDEL